MNDFLLKLKKWWLKNILRRTYLRSGDCNSCGRCCQNIYVKHTNHTLQDENEFKRLRFLHPFYYDLELVSKDEIGLVFKCTNLDKETNKCKIHKKRYGICKRYPQEEIFKMGAKLIEECGYKFEPIESFDDILSKLKPKT